MRAVPSNGFVVGDRELIRWAVGLDRASPRRKFEPLGVMRLGPRCFEMVVRSVTDRPRIGFGRLDLAVVGLNLGA